MTRDLSSSVREIFNGYNVIKQNLRWKEKIEFTPINIVYEPEHDESIPIPCFFTNKIHLAYRSYVGQMKEGNEIVYHRTVKQCPYYENLFAKSHANMKKHTKICGGREGIVYSFDNGDMISVFFWSKNVRY